MRNRLFSKAAKSGREVEYENMIYKAIALTVYLVVEFK